MKRLLLALIAVITLAAVLVGCGGEVGGEPMTVDDVETLEDGMKFIGQQALAQALPFPERTEWVKTEIREQVEVDGELWHLVYLAVDTETSQGNEERQGWIVFVVYKDDQPLSGEPIQVSIPPTSAEIEKIKERFNWPNK